MADRGPRSATGNTCVASSAFARSIDEPADSRPRIDTLRVSAVLPNVGTIGVQTSARFETQSPRASRRRWCRHVVEFDCAASWPRRRAGIAVARSIADTAVAAADGRSSGGANP